jgi:excisionase family DNA binding protein
MSDQALITAAAVARQLGIATRTVYDLAQSGRLASYRPTPGALRFDPSDVAAYKASCRREAKVTIDPPHRVTLHPALDDIFRSQGITPKLVPPRPRRPSRN